MDMIQFRNTLLLLITSVIWGCGFAAQSIGAEFVEPFTFLAARSWLSGIALIPLLCIFGRTCPKPAHTGIKTLLIGGCICGFFLFSASAAQQAGIELTGTAQAGFITSLYILAVPLITLFMGKKAETKFLFCAAIAAVGLYMLCIKDGFTIEKGDSMLLLCAFLYAGHILTVDRFAPHLNGIALSFVQFMMTAILSTICAAFFETPHMSDITAAGSSIAFAGIVSGGIGYTLQIIGQQSLNPTVAGLVMSLESVFAALAGWVFLNQVLTGREFFGCALMFAAVIYTQLPGKKHS